MCQRRLRDDNASLTRRDLVAGLEEFGDRYQALDVFVHDVADLERALQGEHVAGLQPIEGVQPASFAFSEAGGNYLLTVFADHGVARVTREQGILAQTMMGAAIGSAVGGAFGAAVASRPQSHEIAALAGMALGLLIGGVLGATVADSHPPRLVFALRFDPDTKQWRAYDGGLIRWMKERLAAPDLA